VPAAATEEWTFVPFADTTFEPRLPPGFQEATEPREPRLADGCSAEADGIEPREHRVAEDGPAAPHVAAAAITGAADRTSVQPGSSSDVMLPMPSTTDASVRVRLATGPLMLLPPPSDASTEREEPWRCGACEDWAVAAPAADETSVRSCLAATGLLLLSAPAVAWELREAPRRTPPCPPHFGCCAAEPISDMMLWATCETSEPAPRHRASAAAQLLAPASAFTSVPVGESGRPPPS